MRKEEIRLQIPSQADYIDLVRICLYGIASKLGFAFEAIEDMKVAVSEACNNAVLYGDVAEDNQVEIVFAPGECELTIQVVNKGPMFQQETTPLHPPLEGKSISELPVGGLGIYLMQALMDNVTVETANQRTVVTLIKRIPASE